jgi:hypothetical protein
MELGNLMFGNSRGQFPLERGRWQDKFCELTEELELVNEGYVNEFENEVFRLFAYWWGDCTCGVGEDEPCADSCNLVRPNFVHKPTGYEIQWYKYPLRDSYANREITWESFCGVVEDCKQSLVSGD